MKVKTSFKNIQNLPEGCPVSSKCEEMLADKSALKRATPVEIFGDFTDQHLNLNFFSNLGYLQKIYKNLSFGRYPLHNQHGQVLQAHCLKFLLNWSKELICLICFGRSDHNAFKPKYSAFFSVTDFLKISEVVNSISPFKHRSHNRRRMTKFWSEHLNQKSLNFSLVVTHVIFFATLFWNHSYCH